MQRLWFSFTFWLDAPSPLHRLRSFDPLRSIPCARSFPDDRHIAYYASPSRFDPCRPRRRERCRHSPAET
ncbi:hypothetical protein FOA52_006470 [Chlamydomonas sp. UWO 241]|nr:hypothetical protein FOA52_006470 [Chlamydomonas sp. UWO 241]